MAEGKPTSGQVEVKIEKVPCAFVGELLTIKEKESHGLGLSRNYHFCKIEMTANAKKIPGVACSCEGCGRKCGGYLASEKK